MESIDRNNFLEEEEYGDGHSTPDHALRDLYSRIWSHLVDLREAGQALWENANDRVLLKFVHHLREAKRLVAHNEIFLEAGLLADLEKTLAAFDHYRIGKSKLIDLRTSADVRRMRRWEDPVKGDISDQILNNWISKDEYDSLLVRVREAFRSRLLH